MFFFIFSEIFPVCSSIHFAPNFFANLAFDIFGSTNKLVRIFILLNFFKIIDNLLLFNSCIIVKTKDDQYYDLLLEEWLHVYEKLYGGFEDLVSEDESEEEYEGELTRTGYAKDGFVVD